MNDKKLKKELFEIFDQIDLKTQLIELDQNYQDYGGMFQKLTFLPISQSLPLIDNTNDKH